MGLDILVQETCLYYIHLIMQFTPTNLIIKPTLYKANHSHKPVLKGRPPEIPFFARSVFFRSKGGAWWKDTAFNHLQEIDQNKWIYD